MSPKINSCLSEIHFPNNPNKKKVIFIATLQRGCCPMNFDKQENLWTFRRYFPTAALDYVSSGDLFVFLHLKPLPSPPSPTLRHVRYEGPKVCRRRVVLSYYTRLIVSSKIDVVYVLTFAASTFVNLHIDYLCMLYFYLIFIAVLW